VIEIRRKLALFGCFSRGGNQLSEPPGAVQSLREVKSALAVGCAFGATADSFPRNGWNVSARLAHNYRLQFGETPSATLVKSRRA
jgi:hypothetical protein